MLQHPNEGCLLALISLLVSFHETSCFTSAPRPICRPGIEFWSSKHVTCFPCTKCAPEFTLRPCAIHKDAICGPLSALELDWSFLSTGKHAKTGKTTVKAATSKVLWEFPDVRTQNFLESGMQSLQKNATSSEQQIPDSHVRKASITDERILWDWQTGALILAMCACILFFLVAGCSALIYARQWRHTKRNFATADLEELSARLNVMVKAELAELMGGVPNDPCHPEARCQYLEKLLDGRRDASTLIRWPEVTTANLYIEDGGSPKCDQLKIASTDRNTDTSFPVQMLDEAN